MSEQKKRVGVNWSNCPYWEQCGDENKHIMTYCDVQCRTPDKKQRLDRPDNTDKVGDVIKILTRERRQSITQNIYIDKLERDAKEICQLFQAELRGEEIQYWL